MERGAPPPTKINSTSNKRAILLMVNYFSLGNGFVAALQAERDNPS